MILWKDTPHIIAGTTLRNTNIEENNNMALHACQDQNAVRNNRKALSEQLNLPLNNWVFLQQNHSCNFVSATSQDYGKGVQTCEDAIANCDAIYTKEKGMAIGVFTADCLPILLYDPIKEIVCAIHSGWKGTTLGITSKVIEHLITEEGCNPLGFSIYFGPSIAFHSLEVGMEVIEEVKKLPFPTDDYILMKPNGKAMLDNIGLNKAMLLNAGVKEEQITINKNDTFQPNDVLFSYRRDRNCGRHLSFIAMRK